MKHKWWIVVIAFLLLGGGGLSALTGNTGGTSGTSGLLAGGTGTLVLIGLIWWALKK